MIDRVHPEVRELYNILEVEFHPLEMCSRVQPLLKKIEDNPSLKHYVKPIQKLAIVRLLQQVCEPLLTRSRPDVV